MGGKEVCSLYWRATEVTLCPWSFLESPGLGDLPLGLACLLSASSPYRPQEDQMSGGDENSGFPAWGLPYFSLFYFFVLSLPPSPCQDTPSPCSGPVGTGHRVSSRGSWQLG